MKLLFAKIKYLVFLIKERLFRIKRPSCETAVLLLSYVLNYTVGLYQIKIYL